MPDDMIRIIADCFDTSLYDHFVINQAIFVADKIIWNTLLTSELLHIMEGRIWGHIRTILYLLRLCGYRKDLHESVPSP